MSKIYGIIVAGFLGAASLAPLSAQAQNIVEIASGDEQFSTLVDLVVQAGLADALSDPEVNLTVIAPTNDAFAALPQYVTDALEADSSLLSEILLYHVAGSELFAENVVASDAFASLQGENVSITVDGDTVLLNNSTLTATDIDADNGVIHVVDRVMIPASIKADFASIVDIAVEDANFSALVDAVIAQDLAGELSDLDADLTVLAPTNEAFANLPDFALRALEREPELLTEILLYHVIGAEVKSDVVTTLTEATSLQGETITITNEDGILMVDGATVIAADVDAANGVIHVIDQVIVPASILERMQEIDETSLYRFWSEQYRSHFFTASPQERDFIRENDTNWDYEGFSNYTARKTDDDAAAVHRFYSDKYKSHFYTQSQEEVDFIIANDHNWVYEGIGYYALSTQQEGSLPVYRFYSKNYKSHFYTQSEEEKDFIVANDANWALEGIAWYAQEVK